MRKRFKKKIPKQFNEFNGENLIEYFLNRVDYSVFDIIVIVNKKSHSKYIEDIEEKFPLVEFLFANAGNQRQESSFNGLNKLENYKPENVLIHDAARPFCSNKLLSSILKQLKTKDSAIPYVLNYDRKVNLKKENINDKIKFIQTPQGFKFKNIYDAHKKSLVNISKDDSFLISKEKVNFIKGEKLNIKITYEEDINYFKIFSRPIFKSGIGFDIHKLDTKIKTGLKLCGVRINYNRLIGHSDADVGIHAVCDSIFGALSMKDIGYYFSNNNTKWKNINSEYFLRFAKEKLIQKKNFIVNLDINFICEKPNINKYRKKMISNLSNILNIPEKIISIKATSNEKIGFIGDGLGIAAESIVQISNEKTY